jgi:transcriptional regulator with XRE-family HTH domain
MREKRKMETRLPSVAEYISLQIGISHKTQREIAEEMGYDKSKANLITMFKQGLTKVPIGKIKPLAIALGVDPAYLLRIAMTEYMPETLEAIESILDMALTENEKAIVRVIREATGGQNPRMATQAERDLVAATAKKLSV